MSKPHLSPTSLDMLFKCGQQYAYRYLDGLRMPPSVAAARGTGVGRGMALNWRQKIESWTDAAKDDVVDAAVEAFRATWSGGVYLNQDELSKGMSNVKGQTTDQVAALAALGHEEISPRYQPVAVERGIRIDIGATHDLIGYIDLEAISCNGGDDQSKVIDLKTGRRKSQDEADHSTQLSIYAAASCLDRGVGECDVALETVVAASKPAVQTLTSRRGPKDFAVLEKRVDAALRIIQSGNYQPAPSGAWWCSEKWCGYWHQCPFVRK